MASEFSQKVIQIVKNIPVGQVASYGQIAAYVGTPRAARQVGGVLRQAQDTALPWWRVINNQGRISIKNMFHGAAEQQKLLVSEGVKVWDYKIDMAKYRWQPDQAVLKAWGLDEIYSQMLWNRFKTGY